VFADEFAHRILGERARAFLDTHPRRYERSISGRFLRAGLVVRSRIAEDTLADAVACGVRQYVVLGAGLDTFALRNPYPDLRVFEVDHPKTQAWKRKRLRDEGLRPTQPPVFVPVDFEHQQLDTELHTAGLAPDQPTFFSWLGVVPYLERPAIRATLASIARFAGVSGGVVFDFGRRPRAFDIVSWLFLLRRARKLARLGEPFRTYLDPAEATKELVSLGFQQVDVLSSAALNARYFAGRDDRLRVARLMYIARAMRIDVAPNAAGRTAAGAGGH
jgi:methyltransferase (TIGR00027 family)